MAGKMQWYYNPPRQPKPIVPELTKIKVKEVADDFVESVLKPKSLSQHQKIRGLVPLWLYIRNGIAAISISTRNIIIQARMP